jgi:HSP20 family protein
MKILKQKETGLTTTPFPKSFKPEFFFDRMKEFEDSMMRRLYELFTPSFFTPNPEFENVFRGETEYSTVPLELTETEDGFLVHAEVPGFTEKELELRVEPLRIYIGAKKEEKVEPKKGKTLYSERTYHQVARWFDLPFEINPDKVKATLNKGLLEISLLKAQPAKKVPIEVKAA